MKPIYSYLIAIIASCLFSLNAVAQPVAGAGNWSDYTEEVSPDGDTYLVSTPGQLAWILSNVTASNNSFAGKTVKLTADIDLGAHWWVPANGGSSDAIRDYDFRGTLDGDYYKIKNLYIKNDINIQYTALIRSV